MADIRVGEKERRKLMLKYEEEQREGDEVTVEDGKDGGG